MGPNNVYKYAHHEACTPLSPLSNSFVCCYLRMRYYNTDISDNAPYAVLAHSCQNWDVSLRCFSSLLLTSCYDHYVVLTQLTGERKSMTMLTSLYHLHLKHWDTTLCALPRFDASHGKILSDYAHYAVSVHYFNTEISNYAHYSVVKKVLENNFRRYAHWAFLVHYY